MPLETALIWFGVITFVVIAVEIFYTYGTQGFGFGFSSNRPVVEKSALGIRVERVYRNQVEASAYVVPILGGAALMGLNTPGVQIAALLVVLGRAAFCVLYYTGIPFLRIIGFGTVSLSLLYILYVLASGA